MDLADKRGGKQCPTETSKSDLPDNTSDQPTAQQHAQLTQATQPIVRPTATRGKLPTARHLPDRMYARPPTAR